MSNLYACPKCESDNTQSIHMLFQTGVQHSSSRTAGGGVAFTRGGGIAVMGGGAATAGSSSMALIQKYTLPPRPTLSTARIVLAWLLLGCGVLISLPLIPLMVATSSSGGGTGLGCMAFIAALCLIPAVVLIFSHPSYKRDILKKQAGWDARAAYLSNCWVCLRCGHEWSPEA